MVSAPLSIIAVAGFALGQAPAAGQANAPAEAKTMRLGVGVVLTKAPAGWVRDEEGDLVTALRHKDVSSATIRLSAMYDEDPRANAEKAQAFLASLSQRFGRKPEKRGARSYLVKEDLAEEAGAPVKVRIHIVAVDRAIVLLSITGRRNAPTADADMTAAETALFQMFDNLRVEQAAPNPEKLTTTQRPNNPDIIFVADSDPVMKAAIARARETVDQFAQRVAKPTANQKSFAVKAAFFDGEQSEHMWVNELRVDDGKFVGKLNNAPLGLKKYKLGDAVSVPFDQISNWMYLEGQQMVGGASVRLLMDRQMRAKKK